jgi:hypothetical protein
MAVAVRAMHVYGTVLEAALSHPCLRESASAEERSAGAEQLAQQLDRLQASGERVLLPVVVQQDMLLHGRTQCLEGGQGTAAAVGALLGDVPGGLRQVLMCVVWVKRQLLNWGQTQGTDEEELAPAHIQVLTDTSALQHEARRLEVMVLATEQRWQQLQQLRRQMLPQQSLSAAPAAGEALLTADESAVITTAWVQDAACAAQLSEVRSREVVQHVADELCSQLDHSKDGPADLGLRLRAWADAVAAALPSRRCCANPCCVSLREMSEWRMVGGSSCVCGGCAAGSGQAVRYCSRECQAAHWPAHKPLCRRLRQQQLQQQQQEQQ